MESIIISNQVALDMHQIVDPPRGTAYALPWDDPKFIVPVITLVPTLQTEMCCSVCGRNN